MDTSTKIALRESIEHWRRMASDCAVDGEIPTGTHCALCSEFYAKQSHCGGCPVAKAGHPNCDESPYHDARDAWDAHGLSSPEFKAAALKELEFLESLLPKEDHATVHST